MSKPRLALSWLMPSILVPRVSAPRAKESWPLSVYLRPVSAILKSPPLIDPAMVEIASLIAFCSSGLRAGGWAALPVPCSARLTCLSASSWYFASAAW